MRGKHTLVINGKVYDAATGLAVAAPTPVQTVPSPNRARSTDTILPASHTAVTTNRVMRDAHHATSAHTHAQKSVTLRRDVLKKPIAKTHSSASRSKLGAGHVQQSEHIRRFAPHPQPLAASAAHSPRPKMNDVAAVSQTPSALIAQKHALVAQRSKPVIKKSETVLNSRALKERLIAERLAQVDTTAQPEHKSSNQRSRFFSSQPRVASLVTASFAVMVLGGYLTYLNMPGLSVRVAAAQADVAASFPDYHPDGYRFNGPVAYAPGQVAINFAANGGTAKYTITEQKSSWDSQAVYDNIVAKTADESYVTNSQQGLTIYTFTGKAAWVNKGILYTVNGDAPLNNEQLLRIAGSL